MGEFIVIKFSNVSISTRIFLAALAPMLALIALGGYFANAEYSRYASLARLEQLASAAPQMSAIVHELQRERGLSAGFISSRGDAQWTSNLQKQVSETQAALDTIVPVLEAFPAAEFGSSVSSNLSTALAALGDIENVRQRTTGLSQTVPEMAGYYTRTIRSLLNATSAVASLADDADIKGKTTAYVNLLEAKERAGQERAMGAGGFGAGRFAPQTFIRFAQLIAEQDSFFVNVSTFSSSSLEQFYADTVTGSPVEEVERYRETALKAGFTLLPVGYSGAEWFRAISEKIDLLYQVEKYASNEFSEQTTAMRDAALQKLLILCSGIIGAILAAALLCWVFAKSIITPLSRLTNALDAIAGGSFDREVDGKDRGDQIGGMARSIEILRVNSQEAETMKAEQEENDLRAAEEKKQSLNEMADKMESSIGNMVSTLSSAATELAQTARQMSSLAESTSTESSSANTASESATQSVETVATASSELSEAIREVTEQVSTAARLTVDSQEASQSTEEQMNSLSEAAQRIGSVIQLIQEIAEQTNLLALNATIEAARAGESGKGFAVVASEVKNLANQSAKATEEISSHIRRVQSEATSASEAMSQINGKIREINEVTTTVSAAIEEQSSATNEISRSAEAAAEMNRGISTSVSKVKVSSQETGGAAEQVLASATELSSTSEQLRNMVGDFVSSIRAA
jgi:methyl-accepting chemotaxis protein